MELKLVLDEDSPDAKRVAAIFGVAGDELRKRLEALASAAFEEHMLAYTGTRSPSTMRELRELRLRLLFEHLPAGEPTDTQIAQLFQMTPSQAGTLIAGTRARFGVELGDRLRKAAVDVLTAQAKKVDDNTIRVVVDDSLARYMKDLVNQTNAPPFEKSREAARTYEPKRGTIRALCTQLGIEPKQVTALDWED
jgi:hypothetical protein